MELFEYGNSFVDTIKCIVTEQVNGPLLEDFLDEKTAKSKSQFFNPQSRDIVKTRSCQIEKDTSCALRCSFNASSSLIFLFKLVSAVSFCHSRNVVHRGISPANIWVKNDNLSVSYSPLNQQLDRRFR